MTFQESVAAGLPLDQSHIDAANALLDIERRVSPVLNAIKDCGIDCQAEMAAIKDRADFARAFKRNFASDLP